MPALRPFALADWLWLMLVVVTAAGLRVAYLVNECDAGHNDPPVRVQDESPKLELPGQPRETPWLVHNLQEYSWFGSLAPFADREEPTAHVSPGLPWLLGTLARLMPESYERTARWANAGLGTLTALLYFLFARRAFRSLLVGTVTGLLCAVCPFWVVNLGAFDDGALTSFLLAFALLVGSAAVETSGPFGSLLFGLTLAGLSLVRAALLPFAFVSLIWFLWRSRSLQRGWLCGLLAFLGFANGLAPWTVRNFQVFGEPVPIVDSTYLELWIGNNPDATGGPMSEAMLTHAPTDRLRGADSQPLPQPARYAALAGPMFDEIREHPGRTIQRRLRAATRFRLRRALSDPRRNRRRNAEALAARRAARRDFPHLSVGDPGVAVDLSLASDDRAGDHCRHPDSAAVCARPCRGIAGSAATAGRRFDRLCRVCAVLSRAEGWQGTDRAETERMSAMRQTWVASQFVAQAASLCYSLPIN